MLSKTDPYKHLRPGRRKKTVKEKIPKPIIRRITREIYVERIAVAEKPDGIPLKVIDSAGNVIAESMMGLDEYDGE